MEKKSLPVSEMTFKLSNGQAFSLSRWGDGEWHSLLKTGLYANCDRHEYFPEMREDFMEILRNNHPYYHGMLSIANSVFGVDIDNFLRENEIQIEWFSGDAILDASVGGKLRPMIHEIRKKNSAYVGPSHLRGVKDILGCKVFIEVPDRNCYKVWRETFNEIIDAISKNSIELVGFSSGFSSKILIDKVWPHVKNSCSLVDFGSLFDPYFGVYSRSYAKRHDWSILRRVNFGG